MKSITVKVNTQKSTIAQTQIITKDSQPTIIKATKNVNYELIDDATGYAPDHLVAKRSGKDLHISFEDNGQESDLVIEGFYDSNQSALVGQAESGSYHYYIPDTGDVGDYVTQLAQGDIEGQALGGHAYPTAWWLGAVDGNQAMLPWLIGLAGVAAVGTVFAKEHSAEIVIPSLPVDVNSGMSANAPNNTTTPTNTNKPTVGLAPTVDPSTPTPNNTPNKLSALPQQSTAQPADHQDTHANSVNVEQILDTDKGLDKVLLPAEDKIEGSSNDDGVYSHDVNGYNQNSPMPFGISDVLQDSKSVLSFDGYLGADFVANNTATQPNTQDNSSTQDSLPSTPSDTSTSGGYGVYWDDNGSGFVNLADLPIL